MPDHRSLYSIPSSDCKSDGTGGFMMQIPSCSHCNKLIPIGTDDLRCMAFNNNVLLCAGSNYSIKAVDM
ncbi:hypothetical protein [Paludibacter jiangxiensis]|uniref:hypothetical protein n=1 Tax=Paludibacter jiangxiensis TaxID=681398 RepID=UPI000A0174F2|nr:hypothetical protein [Paludibacter jiangxiensis]